MSKIRVRIAPSPTGLAHIGTAYMAMFNWAFARKQNGSFIIRIEDTDVKRNVKGAEKQIFLALKWLGLDWDESVDVGGKYGPYRQSERLHLYDKYIQDLQKSGFAYEKEGAIFLKVAKKDISWTDKVRGEISFPESELKDFVIKKSDGYPVYNFAVVVDDYLMKISHVIRGEEHISNTPRQIAIYNALGFEVPDFAHLPTIRNKDKKKLSKRRDPVDLEIFRKKGYLPQALANFLCLLGWSHPKEKEIFDLNEFKDLLTLERIQKAGPVFNPDKLDWVNSQYIKNLPDKKLTDEIFNLFPNYEKEIITKASPLIKERIKLLSEYDQIAGFFHVKRFPNETLLKQIDAAHLTSCIKALQQTNPWKLEEINANLSNEIENHSYKVGRFYMSVRIAVTGEKATPPINESILLLGKNETIQRIQQVLDKLS